MKPLSRAELKLFHGGLAAPTASCGVNCAVSGMIHTVICASGACNTTTNDLVQCSSTSNGSVVSTTDPCAGAVEIGPNMIFIFA